MDMYECIQDAIRAIKEHDDDTPLTWWTNDPAEREFFESFGVRVLPVERLEIV